MLRYLLPWLQHIPLTINSSSAHYVITIFLFSNLTYITCKVVTSSLSRLYDAINSGVVLASVQFVDLWMLEESL